jgi:molybdopterin synthase sulfur carrier subunit
MTLRVLYFARLRERFGVAEETLACDGATVADLLDALRARGGAWAEELAPGRSFRVAVNQHVATPETPLAGATEVAIFPPVTGG